MGVAHHCREFRPVVSEYFTLNLSLIGMMSHAYELTVCTKDVIKINTKALDSQWPGFLLTDKVLGMPSLSLSIKSGKRLLSNG